MVAVGYLQFDVCCLIFVVVAVLCLILVAPNLMSACTFLVLDVCFFCFCGLIPNAKKKKKNCFNIAILYMVLFFCNTHCESGEGIWLQEEAASETHSLRDAEPHQEIPENAKNSYEIFPKKLRPCNNTNRLTTDFCLPSTAWQ